MICSRCGKDLTANETGLSRKLINRGTKEFFCLQCLSADFKVSVDSLIRMIDDFRRAGCTLFL
ncbi:MAG: hypothetical protein IJD39_10970 [Clostridia bacterium]|nr:hypothetical protein [Clostridia bacterium]